MFGLFGGGGGAKKPLKGYKVTTVNRQQKYGIAANSLQMLKDKASAKLKVSILNTISDVSNRFILKFLISFSKSIPKIDNCRVYLAKDGTEIQDEAYFETIEPQTLFVIASADTPVKTGKTNNSIHLDLGTEHVFQFL